MQRMDCLANFGPLYADFNCVKHSKRKVDKSEGVSVLLGVWWGPTGSWPRNFFLFGHRLGPTMCMMDCFGALWLESLRETLLGVLSVPLGVRWWSPGVMAGGPCPLGHPMMKSNDGLTILGSYKPTFPLVFQMHRNIGFWKQHFQKGMVWGIAVMDLKLLKVTRCHKKVSLKWISIIHDPKKIFPLFARANHRM